MTNKISVIRSVSALNCAVKTIDNDDGTIDLIVYGLEGMQQLSEREDITKADVEDHITEQVRGSKGCSIFTDYDGKKSCKNSDCSNSCCYIYIEQSDLEACGCLYTCPST